MGIQLVKGLHEGSGMPLAPLVLTPVHLALYLVVTHCSRVESSTFQPLARKLSRPPPKAAERAHTVDGRNGTPLFVGICRGIMLFAGESSFQFFAVVRNGFRPSTAAVDLEGNHLGDQALPSICLRILLFSLAGLNK